MTKSGIAQFTTGAFLALASLAASAARWSWDATNFYPGYGDVSATLTLACTSSFGSGASSVGYGPSTPWGNSSTVAGSHIAGRYFYWRCQNGGVFSDVQITIYEELPTCTAGTPHPMRVLTTIASIDSFGRSVAADPIINPQCINGCVIAKPTNGQSASTCTGYLNPNVARTVGAQMWVSCIGDGEAMTGQTCNAPGASQQGVTSPPSMPVGFVPDNGGGDSGGGGGLSEADSARLEVIKVNMQNTATESMLTNSRLTTLTTAINGLRADANTRETAAVTRHNEMQGALADMLAALNAIDENTANGSGGSGIPADGFSATGDVGEGPIVPTIEHPDGGLKSPGEGTLDAFRTAMNTTPDRAIGACPTWALQSDFFGQTYMFDQHCQLFNDNRAVLESVMVACWSLAAVAIVLKA